MKRVTIIYHDSGNFHSSYKIIFLVLPDFIYTLYITFQYDSNIKSYYDLKYNTKMKELNYTLNHSVCKFIQKVHETD